MAALWNVTKLYFLATENAFITPRTIPTILKPLTNTIYKHKLNWWVFTPPVTVTCTMR